MEQQQSDKQIDLVYIGGTGRSGSTVLQRALGTLDRHLPVGELTYIWKGGFAVNRLCGCGKTFRTCEFWNAVIDKAFGGMDQVDAEHVRALRKATHSWQSLLFLAFPWLRPSGFQADLSAYASYVDALYQAIWEVSGHAVIIDSSKVPSHAFVLAEIPRLRTTMIHLVRDSRACTYSWQRTRQRVDNPHAVEYMKNLRPSRVSADWIINHTWMKRAAARFDDYIEFRYEDFAAEPRRVLAELTNRIGVENPADLPFVSADAIRLGPDHALMGNPGRFEQGAITIRPDVEWQQRLPSGSKFEVTLLTLPWLLKYRYPLGSRDPVAARRADVSTSATKQGRWS